MARWRALLLCVALVACAGVRTAVAEEAAADAAADAGPPPDFAKLRVKELQAILAARGEECKGCSEKADLVARAAEVCHLPIKARLLARAAALRLRDALFCTKFITETRSWLRRGASAASCADSRAGWFATRAQAAPEEKKEEKTPPNKEDVDKILRDLKIKMPGFVTAGTAADAASAAERPAYRAGEARTATRAPTCALHSHALRAPRVRRAIGSRRSADARPFCSRHR